MLRRFRKTSALIVVLVLMLSLLAGCGQEQAAEPAAPAAPENPDVILATTTSTENSGLLGVLIPKFEEQTGYKIKTVAVGTGAALKMGQNGEADVLMTHAPASEQPLVDDGYVMDYTLLMHNDFVVVGPAADPAGIKDTADASEALKKIADAKTIFISRGDDSGTHKKELKLWAAADIKPEGTWYQESGSGMGNTLNVTAEKDGYTLTDRATYLNLKENLTNLEILFEGDDSLMNIYHAMAVNPEKYDKANYDGAKAFIDYLVTPETQEVIGEYGKDKFGQPLFFPDAK